MRVRHVLPLGVLTAALAFPLHGQAIKRPTSELDRLSFAKRELRVSQTLVDSDRLNRDFPARAELQRFRQRYGERWRFIIDERTGRVNLAEGGAIPFGSRSAAGAVQQQQQQQQRDQLESLARAFLAENRGVFGINPQELVADRSGTAAVGGSIQHVRFQWVRGGVPVEGASVALTVNNGNLIQIGSQKIGDITVDPRPAISVTEAWQQVRRFADMSSRDRIIDQGTLLIIPITPRGIDPDSRDVPFGRMIDYLLVWRLTFERPGVIGRWEALVDAKTGEIVRFRDRNVYGHIQGGVYKTDVPQTEVSASFGLADYGSSLFANAVGDFPAVAGTSTMTGGPGGVRIVDDCGPISGVANGVGLIDFGSSAGTDCTTPGFGGAGNTHAARTQYWNVTEIKRKALTYLPANAWLNGTLTDNVNISSVCNANWSGGSINFFRSGTIGSGIFGPFTQTCGNTGELPGISLHEFGHGMDELDGSGLPGFPDNSPVETRADWTAVLQTHSSCIGAGFATARSPLPAYGLNCVGYGNPCTGCTGIRGIDFAGNTNTTPYTPQNNGTAYNCSSFGSYFGPCGWEDHCESGIASQALWDFVNRDLVGAPTNLDLTSAWQLADRLFYAGAPTSTSMYTCTPGSPTVSNGCGAGSLYSVMRAIDDDGDGVGNGTPHAAAIFAALDRHGIACGTAADPANQNQTSCPPLTTPVVSSSANNHSVTLNWTSGGGSATRYFVFRNETACGEGFTRIATVMAPTTTYTDNTIVHGVTYNYRIQAATANDSCVSAMSNCTTATATLAADQDFYVRDWTSTTSSFDTGAEPSTNPVFWHTSDVWNKGTNAAGTPNANGWYDTDNMYAGAGALGNNFAFVRVHRNTAGTPATVTAHFLISPFGTGSAYVDASAAADPTITFGAADTSQVIATGFPWHQDEVASTHACLAVQISTPDDPYVTPGLLGQTPGPGDYLILNDNNKAQRNLGVSINVVHFAGLHYALIHNPAVYTRDVTLQYASPGAELLDGSVIEVVGGESRPFRSGDSIVLRGMEPGENRWIALRHQVATQTAVPVNFNDVDGAGPVNGFTILATPVTVDEAIRDNLRNHVQVFNRLEAAFGARGGRKEAAAARQLGEAPTPQRYVAFLRDHSANIRTILGSLIGRNDRFGALQTLDELADAASAGQADRAAAAHGTLLKRLDSFATMRQKSDGDPADILQMVKWQEALYRTRPDLQRLPCSADLVAASQAFIRAYDAKNPNAYRDLLGSLNGCYAKTVLGVPKNKLDVEKGKVAMFVKGIFSSPAKLQRAHRQYLLALQEAVGPVQP